MPYNFPRGKTYAAAGVNESEETVEQRKIWDCIDGPEVKPVPWLLDSGGEGSGQWAQQKIYIVNTWRLSQGQSLRLSKQVHAVQWKENKTT